MTDAGKRALWGSVLYTILVAGIIVGLHFSLEGHVGDGWTAIVMYVGFIFVLTTWLASGIRGWPSGLPNPF